MANTIFDGGYNGVMGHRELLYIWYVFNNRVVNVTAFFTRHLDLVARYEKGRKY